MKEEEWLACTDPQPMLEFLLSAPDNSNRKFRLFACACGRLSWHLLDDLRCRSIEVAEQYADGLTTDDELERNFGLSEPELRSERLSHLVVAWMCVRSNARNAALTSTCYAQAACLPFLHDIFGNPFRPVTLDPSWLSPNVKQLAEAIYEERAFDRLPILADALEDSGCGSEAILNHFRGSGPHTRGCWALDLVLGTE